MPNHLALLYNSCVYVYVYVKKGGIYYKNMYLIKYRSNNWTEPLSLTGVCSHSDYSGLQSE